MSLGMSVAVSHVGGPESSSKPRQKHKHNGYDIDWPEPVPSWAFLRIDHYWHDFKLPEKDAPMYHQLLGLKMYYPIMLKFFARNDILAAVGRVQGQLMYYITDENDNTVRLMDKSNYFGKDRIKPPKNGITSLADTLKQRVEVINSEKCKSEKGLVFEAKSSFKEDFGLYDMKVLGMDLYAPNALGLHLQLEHTVAGNEGNTKHTTHFKTALYLDCYYKDEPYWSMVKPHSDGHSMTILPMKEGAYFYDKIKEVQDHLERHVFNLKEISSRCIIVRPQPKEKRATIFLEYSDAQLRSIVPSGVVDNRDGPE
ncbi:hypothetical protein T439DRAFT_383833, partial [Meredithblackwellia eburnea MCA 4105]